MLKYIQQFVQTVLKEASKSRPKSRRSNRSSVDLMKNRSSMKPEILAIDFNEGQEAEHSKEILELKRTYSLLMKKFVNPNLDLMASSKTESDTTIFNLKAKQEIIKSIINRIFYESTQHKKLEGTSRDFSGVNVKPTVEEKPSFGWSGQRINKLAANPMVEKSSHSNNTTRLSLPKTQVGPLSKVAGKADNVNTDTVKLNNPKKQLIQLDGLASGIKASESCKEIKKENISVDGVINTNQNYEGYRNSKAEIKEDLQTPKNLEFNKVRLSDTNEKVSHCCIKENVIQHNQKKNLNMIRSITKVDQRKTAKPDIHPLTKKKNETINVVKSTNTVQNKEIRNQINIPQKIGKNLKTSVDNKKRDIGVLKENKTTNDKVFSADNKEQSLSSNIILEVPSPDSLPRDLPPDIDIPPSTKKTYKLNKVTLNGVSEKVELSQLNCNSIKETGKGNAAICGEKLSKSNYEPFEEKQCHTSYNEEKMAVCGLKEPQYSNGTDQAKTNIEKSTDKPINEITKSVGNTYWNYISKKLIQTGNDAHQFITGLEISNWKNKNVSTADAVNKDLIGNNTTDKPNRLKLTNESSEQDNQNIHNSSNIKASSSLKSKVKGVADVERQEYQNCGLKAPPSAKSEEQNYSKKTVIKKPNSLESQAKGSHIRLSKLKNEGVNYPPKEDGLTKKFSNNFKYYNAPNKTVSDSDRSNTNTHMNNQTAHKEMQPNGFKDKADVTKIKSTASIQSRNHEKCTSELHSKESKNINSDMNIMPEGDSKIKKILRRYTKIQKNKSKTNIGNVQRIYNMFLNDGQIKKMSLYKLKANKDKNFIHKVRKVMRTKSGNLATNETLSSNIPIKENTDSARCETKVNSLSTNKNKMIINRRKIPVSSTKVPDELTIKVNKVNSNVFPPVSRNIFTPLDSVGHSTSNQFDQSTIYDNSRKIKTDFDLTKPRKLYSKREICKSTNLKMYGAKRSIYTHSNRKMNLSKDLFSEGDCENIGEPNFLNMASRSLINVSKVTSKQFKNSMSPLTTQVKGLHTTRFTSYFRGKLPKKRSTIIKQNKRTKPACANSTAKVSPTEEGTDNISKSEEINLQNEPSKLTDTCINKLCSYISPKSEVVKESPLQVLESNHEKQNKRTDIDINDSVKGASDSSLLPSPVEDKINDNFKVLYNRPEKNEYLHVVNSLKKDTVSDNFNITTPHCSDITVKSTEYALNVESQNDPSSFGKEIESPKWMSKADRLEKWKLEVASNNTNDADKKANVQFVNHLNDIQIEGIKKIEAVTLEKKCDKKEPLVDHETKSSTNEITEENHVHKVKRDTKTYNDSGNKINKVEQENKKTQKEAAEPLTTKNHLVQNKCENNKIMPITIKSNNEIDKHIKIEVPTQKLKEFESKLKTLESKLRALELKSLNVHKSVPLPKTQAQKDTGVTSSSEGSHVIMNRNKTKDKATQLNKECILSQNNTNIKNQQPVKLESIFQKKNSETVPVYTDSITRDKILQTIRSDTLYQNKNKVTLLDNKSDKKNQKDTMKEHLSKKVKNLELKLKSLETTIQDLKVEPKGSASNKELHKISLLSRTPEENIKPKSDTNTRKLDEKKYHLNSENNFKLSHVYNKNQNDIGIQNKERYNTNTVVYAKPEVYLKHYLTGIKNNFEEKNQKNTLNNTNHLKSTSVSVPPQSARSINLKNNNVKSVEKSSEEIMKERLLPKSVKMSKNKEAKKNMLYVKNSDVHKTIYDKIIYTKQSNSLVNETNTCINQNKSGQNVHSASSFSRTNNINLTVPKRNELSKSASNVTVQLNQSGSSKAPLESKIYKVKSKNNSTDDEKIKNTTISKNISLKKCPSFSTEKKTLLKKNQKKYSMKKGYAHFDRGIHMVEKQNPLHEGLVKSLRYVNIAGSDNGNATMDSNKTASSASQIKHFAFDQNLKSPVLPKKILKTLSNLKIIPGKQECSKCSNSEIEVTENRSVDSTGTTVKQIKVKTNQKLEKNYNSFDHYRPKRRTYQVKHPIEKEKYGFEFLSTNENVNGKLYLEQLSQNSTLQSEYPVERVKKGKLFNKDDNKLNPLITYNNSISVQPFTNEVIL